MEIVRPEFDTAIAKDFGPSVEVEICLIARSRKNWHDLPTRMKRNKAFSTQINEAPIPKKASVPAFSIAWTARSNSSDDRPARVSEIVIA